ncbi:crotonase/enoyl-CoA hydratase family protein [Pseudomonas sp. UL073]|uniref:Crotonase/enoyl-CoA hydratase family protein n=1 Tax=Zestomonas insulae TaxID=2809017 RepID=A0ABS2I7U6_9GAMM|nr:crotonase/enoyl-CoA hydratase family protein [Pseudomonas insulae]MBM7059229.1 crotonase/enoyl-CoA hydratase family protein [Pseudomonas insulae]
MTHSSSGRVTREKRGHLLLIGLDRVDKRNAFDLTMLTELCLAYGEFERDPDARVALVFAHGEHFTGGMDLPSIGPSLAAGWKVPAKGRDPFGTFGGQRVSKPVIVAAQGYCFTVGIELMLASDINLCSSNARFAQMEVQRGIFPFAGATLRLPKIAGWGNAMRWLLTGDQFDAFEAYRLGLVQEVVAPEELMPRALQLAERIAEQAPLGVQATLASARQALTEGESAAIASFATQVPALMASEDAAEGLRAMQERRPGDFKGR